MIYVNAMDERLVFQSLRAHLVSRGFGYRSLFWLTGILAIFLSPIIDNLTTALVMCAVLLAAGMYNERFFGHLNWTPVILIGYAASILFHMWINSDTFNIPVTAG